MLMIASVASYYSAKGEGPDKQVQNEFARMLSVNIVIPVYFLHLLMFNYKNLGLCRKSLMLLEYWKRYWELSLYCRI